MSSKRPKLKAVYRKGADAPDEPQPPAPTPEVKPAQEAAKMVQLNVAVDPELRRAARLKALQEDRELASVVRVLLRRWVDGDLEA